MTTYVKQLRDKAMELPETDKMVPLLRQAADDVDDALVKAYKLGTLSALRHLNGEVAKAHRVMRNVVTPEPTDPTSGGDEEWELQQEQRRAA